jgi:hypothetical protein
MKPRKATIMNAQKQKTNIQERKTQIAFELCPQNSCVRGEHIYEGVLISP